MSLQGRDADYVLGSSEAEQARLRAQGDRVAPLTERVFRQAGIGPGMRILDLGCGVGDVSLLVARLVGPEGAVLGVDREPAQIEAARARAAELRLTNLSFMASDFRALEPEHGRFDAAVGRLVLMYQADPVEAARAVMQRVRPGGVIVFQEYDATVPCTCVPPLPLREQVQRWIWETLRRAGTNVQTGMQLYPILEAAGLEEIEVRAEGIVHTPRTHYPGVALVRVLLPKMIEFGVATAEEVGVDTLEARLQREIQESGGVALGLLVWAAWGRTPAQA